MTEKTQFTEQQIKDFVRQCKEGDIGPAYPDMLCKSVQIIKQLQAEIILRKLFSPTQREEEEISMQRTDNG